MFLGVPRSDHLSTFLFNILINVPKNVIIYSNILLFADNIKLLKIIKTKQDAIYLQSDINNLLSRCDINHLNLNTNTCKFMHFNVIKNQINFHYFTNIIGRNPQRFRSWAQHFKLRQCLVYYFNNY